MPADSGERSPLLAATSGSDSDHEIEHNQATETSPLLSSRREPNADIDDPTSRPQKDESQSRRKRRWPSLIAMLVLGTLVVVVMVLGFVVPPAVQEYVEHAVVLEPTDLSVESLTADGVRARVKATFRLDASRVQDENARRIGRIATSIMRQIGTEETTLRVHLPHFDNALLGSAVLPPINLQLVDGKVTDLDFVTDFAPGDTETARNVVNQWLQGNLDQLKVTGATAVSLKSGILPLGTHDIKESMVFEAKELPSMPEYTIDYLVFHDTPVGDDGQMGVAANVSISTYNEFPVGITVPSFGFEVLVPNCDSSQPNIKVASGHSSATRIRPRSNVSVEAEGTIRELPQSLIQACPSSELSPLDNFMKRYLHGEDAEIFVRGKAPKDGDLPGWIGDFIESMTIPLQFPGRSLDNFLRNFTLEDVDFKLPSPFADPSDADGKPRVSGTVRVLAAIPADLNINVDVNSLRASGDLYYEGKKFGELHVDDWQKANSSIINQPDGQEDLLSVRARINEVPVDILDGDTFSDIVEGLLFGDEDIVLDVNSTVDVKVSTVLGDLVIRGVPATGKVPVKHMPGDRLAALKPQVGAVHILNTSSTAVHLEALVNVTNPTPYTASIPFMNVHVVKGEHIIGEATAVNMRLDHGKNVNMRVEATWDPATYGGTKGHSIARRLLSEYLSGKNTTITIRAHKDSIPAVPVLGKALSKINMTLSTPRLKIPGDDDDDGSHGFLRSATFHVLSSSASFILASPLGRDVVSIEYLNATAFYNHTESVGQITHVEPFMIPPGLSETPKLPVQWSASHIGYDKLRQALGGTLKLDAEADVIVRLGHWIESVKYKGEGIGSKISV